MESMKYFLALKCFIVFNIITVTTTLSHFYYAYDNRILIDLTL